MTEKTFLIGLAIFFILIIAYDRSVTKKEN